MDILFKNDNFKPPCRNYYLIAKNGIFLCKENQCFSASIRVDETLNLEEHKEIVNWKLPKIPSIEVQRAIAFFKQMMLSLHTESLLWIYYSSYEQRYEFYAPLQKVSSISVHTSDKTPTPEGWLRIGTMHSHPGNAFHSGGDDEDEKHFDGLHITVGNLQKNIPDFSCSLVVAGKRFILPTEKVLDIDIKTPFEFKYFGEINSNFLKLSQLTTPPPANSHIPKGFGWLKAVKSFAKKLLKK